MWDARIAYQVLFCSVQLKAIWSPSAGRASSRVRTNADTPLATSATTLAAMITVIVRRGISRGPEAILTDCGVANQAKGIAGGEAVLVRYLTEGTPSVRDVAKVTASLVEHGWRVREGLV